jgi:hypothetical protein
MLVPVEFLLFKELKFTFLSTESSLIFPGTEIRLPLLEILDDFVDKPTTVLFDLELELSSELSYFNELIGEICP